MPPRQMPTEPELPNIMDPNFRPNINPQPQAVIDNSKKHPIDVRLQGYLPQFNKNSKPSTEIRLPDKQMYNDKQKLLENIKDENIFRKHLPKQAELDKYMEKLKKKFINNYELPLTTKELIPEQKHSPFFKDIYKYVTSGRIPSDVIGKAAHILKRECENYLIAEGVLFQIRIPSEPNEEPELLLCIPENNTQYLLYHYHDTLLAAHQGVTRMYLTIREKFFVPRLFDNI